MPAILATYLSRNLKPMASTDGGAAKNFLNGWTPASIVVSVDIRAVTTGGKLLAIWGATVSNDKQIDRAGRPLTGNALLGTVASAEERDALKERYNAATPATAGEFVPEIEKGLAPQRYARSYLRSSLQVSPAARHCVMTVGAHSQ